MRRVVSVAPQSSLLSGLAPASTRAPATFSLCCNPRGQQRRRYSSSKPSSPNDSPKDPKGISDGQVTTTPTQSSTKQSTEKRKRKNKEWTDIQQNLPSVPSTQNVPQEAIALSTFFSLHRPMSVTHSFPKTVTDDAFAQIFAPATKNSRYTDVMTTLSRTVDEIERPMENLSLDSHQAGETIADANGESMHKIDLKHPDGSESSVYVQLNTMSGNFLPFRPPPLPEAETAAETADKAKTASLLKSIPQTRIYKAMFTLEESTDNDGQIRVVAHSPELVDDVATPRTFLERMALRQIRWREEGRRQSPNMLAISVRRQRKLKMKKKKYKKLMKRTRNVRRKLDRI
ncbi:hypothetical protein F4804DRAFT_342401 [Jackrogersella minutella]|nr:hypothetical protein F4804DRAFT_342401 [Jackrogersella minutella]